MSLFLSLESFRPKVRAEFHFDSYFIFLWSTTIPTPSPRLLEWSRHQNNLFSYLPRSYEIDSTITKAPETFRMTFIFDQVFEPKFSTIFASGKINSLNTCFRNSFVDQVHHGVDSPIKSSLSITVPVDKFQK